MSDTTATAYRENFTKLETIVQKLSQQDVVDVDQLIPMIDEALAAYQVCQQRINQVENLLASRLQAQTPKEDTSV